MSISEAPPAAPPAAVLSPPPPTAPATEPAQSQAAPVVVPVVEPSQQGSEGNAPDRRLGLGRLPRVPFELFLAVLIGATILGVVTLLNQVNRNDAEAARREAEQTLATAETSATEMATANAALAATNADLVEANGNLQVKVDAIEEDLDTERAAREGAEAEVVELRAIPEVDTTPLEDEVATLGDQVATLEQQNTDLTAAVETAEDAVADFETEFAFFPQYLGDALAAGDTIPVTDAESQCLGAAVIDDLGLAAVGDGLSAAATADAAVALDASFRSAITTCDVTVPAGAEG